MLGIREMQEPCVLHRIAAVVILLMLAIQLYSSYNMLGHVGAYCAAKIAEVNAFVLSL